MLTKNLTRFCFWIKITTKLKPHGPRFKRFEFWTKVTKSNQTLMTILTIYFFFQLCL
ncbi:hypothetical protein HanPI659440_Chr10g0361941 [Helianthus annuus]|nr:hypothetical protein HanPI659440_Chr10g0361941 [Helianthus annuus]